MGLFATLTLSLIPQQMRAQSLQQPFSGLTARTVTVGLWRFSNHDCRCQRSLRVMELSDGHCYQPWLLSYRRLSTLVMEKNFFWGTLWKEKLLKNTNSLVPWTETEMGAVTVFTLSLKKREKNYYSMSSWNVTDRLSFRSSCLILKISKDWTDLSDIIQARKPEIKNWLAWIESFSHQGNSSTKMKFWNQLLLYR